MISHPIFPLAIENSSAKLILTPCPGTKEATIEASLKDLKRSGVSAVITLMETEELKKLSLEHIGKLAKSIGLSWFHLPIEDDSQPDLAFHESWESARIAIHRLLENEKSIAIHCKGGSGRTGIVAAKILLERGEKLEKVLPKIKKIRPNAFSLPLQVEYIESVQQALIRE